MTGPRPKIYLDTSVLSHLYADDAPEQRDDTWRLWDKCVAGEYGVCVSQTVLDELGDAPEAKQELISRAMKSVPIHILPQSDEVERLAAEYVKEKVLTEKHYNDRMHLAYATVYGCDALVSLNFKHLVRDSTLKGSRLVSSANRYKEIAIVSPAMLIGGGGE